MNLNSLFEAPISHWTIDPDFDRNEAEMISKFHGYDREEAHYSPADKRAIRDEGTVLATKSAFNRCPVPFSIYFWQSTQPDYDPTSFRGLVDEAWMRKRLGDTSTDAILAQNGPETIGIVITNNLSDEHKISLKSLWMFAHRIAHALIGGNSTSAGFDIQLKFDQFLQKVLSVGYSLEWPNEETGFGHSLAQEYRQIYGKFMGNTIGTMASARKGALVTNWEWYYETFCQFLMTGKVRLKPLPEHFDEEMDLTTDPRARYRVTRAWERFPEKISEAFERMLRESAGNIFVV